MEDLVKLRKALMIARAAIPGAEKAIDEIAELYGVKVAADSGYNGEFPDGFSGIPVTSDDYIAKAEDNIRKYGIGTSNFRGDSNIENLYNSRHQRFESGLRAKMEKNSAEYNALVAQYDKLNPYPLSTPDKEVGVPFTLSNLGDKWVYNPGDATSTAIPKEVIP